jgi:2-desacetyl-2-hydroxyethyl bacteriochlorophyllide A dehydrogenase
MKTQSVIFPEPMNVAIVEEDIPDDPAPGHLLVQTTVSLISTGTEMFCLRGDAEPGTSWAGYIKFPFRPGYSNVGRVLKVGDGVTNFAPGDRVVNSSGHTAFYAIDAADAFLVRIPDAVSDEDATWSVISFVVQTGVRRAEHNMGDTAVVLGLGPLGQLAVQFLRLLGLSEILAIDTGQMRLDQALAHGATAGFCGSAADALDFVRDHTGGRLADVVYDVTGAWQVLPMALRLPRDFGKVILIGDTPYATRQHLTQDVLWRQITLTGSNNCKLPPEHAYWTGARQMQLFLEYLRRGLIRVSDLVTHRFAPEDAPKAYTFLQEDRASTIGVLFDWR